MKICMKCVPHCITGKQMGTSQLVKAPDRLVRPTHTVCYSINGKPRMSTMRITLTDKMDMINKNVCLNEEKRTRILCSGVGKEQI